MRQKPNTLRAQISHALDPLIPLNSSCVLLDFPHHGNVGDSAIWLGEIAYLKSRKCRINYICDSHNYNQAALQAALGKNIILLHGGGNFGDLYPRHQKFRERIIVDFPNNRIIQLPQSIHFINHENLVHAQKIFSQHLDFHLIVRDKPSYDIAQQHFTNPTYLCPDMALMLDIPTLIGKPNNTDIVVLSRTDKEKSGSLELDATVSLSIEVVDWLDEPEPRLEWLYDWAHERLAWRSKVPVSILNRFALYAANNMARQRLDRGVELISQGKVLVTDRLHALILGWLGGMPVFFIDNSYGKLSNVTQAWLVDTPNLKKCHSFTEAIEQASKFLDEAGSII